MFETCDLCTLVYIPEYRKFPASLTREMHLSNNDSRHICIKTFTKQDLDIPGYQFVIHENMNFAEYQMSYKGAAGKAFSAHMPIYIAFFGLRARMANYKNAA